MRCKKLNEDAKNREFVERSYNLGPLFSFLQICALFVPTLYLARFCRLRPKLLANL